MSVKIRPYRKGGGYEVDIMIRLPNGQTHRERRKSPFTAKSASLRWGKERERFLLINGLTNTETKKELPTLAEFAPRYLVGYAKANGLKPSTIASKNIHLRNYLIPAFGDKRLDEITAESVQRFKAKHAERSNKTINNVLTTLSTTLKCAVEWGLLEELPVRIKRMRVRNTAMDFFNFDEYTQLIAAASALGPEHLAFTLLAGDAGLRAGEIRGLHWSSINFARRVLTVQHSEYKGELTTPKHDKIRTVPMTMRLTTALKALREDEGLVFTNNEGGPVTPYDGRKLLDAAQHAAELRCKGPHMLRHTLCSHLAMRGIGARVIQQLVGHASLVTTQRYMHLAPGATEAAIAMMESPSPNLGRAHPMGGSGDGDMLEEDPRGSAYLN